MQIEYDFVEIDASDSLEEFIKEQLALAIPGMSRQEGRVVIHLAKEENQISHRSPEFQCEIAAFYGGKAEPMLRVFKTHEDLLHAISQAVNAFKVAYRHDHRQDALKDSRLGQSTEPSSRDIETSRPG